MCVRESRSEVNLFTFLIETILLVLLILSNCMFLMISLHDNLMSLSLDRALKVVEAPQENAAE